MRTNQNEIDGYIAGAATFAKPILSHIRKLVHKGCPNVEETLKWGFPHFQYHGIMCSMAAFKEHCAFGFWKASRMHDPHNLLSRKGKTAMGNFGRIESRSDLPPDHILVDYIREAARLNKEGVKVMRPKPKKKVPLRVPGYFKEALAGNKKALDTFAGFSYSHKKEYLEWVTEAKSEETREKRLSTAIEWMAEGKGRNWKYERK